MMNDNQAYIQHNVNTGFQILMNISNFVVDNRKNLVYSKNIEKAFTK
jgi:hypothetical protein